jgi:RimJ/RimL family protein N-acetyltransferase
MSDFSKQNLIFIRKLQQSDLKKLAKFRNKKIIWQLTEGSSLSKKATINSTIAWFKKVNKKKDRLNLAICLNEKYIGNIYFTDIKKSSAQFHIFIGENSLWGKGLGLKSVLLSLVFLKINLDIKKVYLKVNKENISAIKLYKKCGFKVKKELDINYYFMTNY